jgi:NADPH-dependent 2,4-dienoyl-CoA reductase/sulfur reductase-like enzyme
MTTSILIAGAGPAGLSAAIAAAGAGARVLVVDEGIEPGGQLGYRLADDAPATRSRLLKEAAAAGVEIESSAVVWGVFAGDEATISRNGESRRVSHERLILATGSTDRAMSFSGSTLPGVLTARALQILMHRHRVLPGKRFAVLGAHGDEIAHDIGFSGGTVVVRDPGANPERLVARGERGVESLSIDGQRHEVDAIVLALGTLPDPRLAVMAECAIVCDPATGGYTPIRDRDLRTTNGHTFAAGEIAGAAGIKISMLEGRLAGLAAAASLGLVADAEVERARRELATIAPGRVQTDDVRSFVQFAGQEQWL